MAQRVVLGSIPPVPVVNSSDNNNIADVIGNKEDGHSGSSLMSIAKTLTEHAHKPQMIYPDLANHVTLTADAAAWTLGAFAEVVPVNTITEDFDIHFLCLADISANDHYQINLYNGTVFIGSKCFSKSPAGEPSNSLRVQTGDDNQDNLIVPANSQIQAKVASASASARTVGIKLEYHLY